MLAILEREAALLGELRRRMQVGFLGGAWLALHAPALTAAGRESAPCAASVRRAVSTSARRSFFTPSPAPHRRRPGILKALHRCPLCPSHRHGAQDPGGAGEEGTKPLVAEIQTLRARRLLRTLGLVQDLAGGLAGPFGSSEALTCSEVAVQ